MRCRLTIVTTLLVVVCFGGCRAKVEKPDQVREVSWGPDPSFADTPTSVTVRANNQFACELFKQLSKEQPGTNQFFSPWSISSVLAMALEGARGDTALEMGQVLGLSSELRQEGSRPWKLDDYHSGFATLMRHYAAAQNSKKDQPVREKIAKLRKELESLNAKVRGGAIIKRHWACKKRPRIWRRPSISCRASSIRLSWGWPTRFGARKLTPLTKTSRSP